MTYGQIKHIDPDTIDFLGIVETARLYLHREMGCDQQPGCFAAGDVGGLARKVFAKTLYGEEMAGPLLDHAGLPVMGVFGSGPDTKDIPLVRQGCLLTYRYASYYLCCDLEISFGRALGLVADWMHERFARGTPEEFTQIFHPCRRGPAPVPRASVSTERI